MFPEDIRGWERTTPFQQIIETRFLPEGETSGISIDDRLYGTFEFDADNNGDAAIIEIVNSEYFQRLGLVRQLILPPDIATRPETADFTRLEHSIGCMLLTRKLGGDSRQQLRALLHDIATTAFSHLGDWLKQGMDGADNHHDSMQPDLLHLWGIDEILDTHGFTLEDVSNDGKQDFVERNSPDLCVDRVDYALREFARWTCPGDVAQLVEDLRVKDDMIVFDNTKSAATFAYNYRELFLRHWAHDRHMVKEVLFFHAIRYAIESGILSDQDMYGVDSELMTKIELMGDEVIEGLLWLARGDEERLKFLHIKGSQEMLNLDEDYSNFKNRQDRLYFLQRGFRERWVDPSFVDQETGLRVPLSFVDGDHRQRYQFYLEMVHGEFQSEESIYGMNLLHFVEIVVDPRLKNTLSGVGSLI